jgi:hypothetical protein
VAQVFIPISGSNIGSHLAQIFVDIHIATSFPFLRREIYILLHS